MRMTSRLGSRSLAMMAVHSPLYPPPTMHRSQLSVRTSVGLLSGSSASSYQYGYGSASAIASRWNAW